MTIQMPLKENCIVACMRLGTPSHTFPCNSCRYYADLAGEENAKAYKTLIFLAGSASAEFFADIGLCPFEAVKVQQSLLCHKAEHQRSHHVYLQFSCIT